MDSVSAVAGAQTQNIRPPAQQPAEALTRRPIERPEQSADARAEGTPDATERAATKLSTSSVAQDFRDLNVVLDEASGKIVFQSLDADTGEIKNQVPTEEILKLAASLRSIVGLFIDDRV